MDLRDKGLRVIEAMVSDELSERIGVDLAMGRPIRVSVDDIAVLAKKITAIYQISHSLREDAMCYAAHDGWRDEIDETYRRFKEARLC